MLLLYTNGLSSNAELQQIANRNVIDVGFEALFLSYGGSRVQQFSKLLNIFFSLQILCIILLTVTL